MPLLVPLSSLALADWNFLPIDFALISSLLSQVGEVAKALPEVFEISKKFRTEQSRILVRRKRIIHQD
jgi:hypothetical protein